MKEVLAVGHIISKAPLRSNLRIFTDSTIAQCVFKKGTSKSEIIRRIVAEADLMASNRGITYIVERVDTHSNLADSPSRKPETIKTDWQRFFEKGKPLSWNTYWLHVNSKMAHVRDTPFNEQRMLATAIMTNACKVAVIDHYAHRILEHDDLF